MIKDLFLLAGIDLYLSQIVGEDEMPPLHSSVPPQQGYVFELNLTRFGFDGEDSSVELPIEQVLISNETGAITLAVNVHDEDKATIDRLIEVYENMADEIDADDIFEESVPEELMALDDQINDFSTPIEQDIVLPANGQMVTPAEAMPNPESDQDFIEPITEQTEDQLRSRFGGSTPADPTVKTIRNDQAKTPTTPKKQKRVKPSGKRRNKGRQKH